LVTDTDLALVQSGWMTFSAKALNHQFTVVSTMAGETTRIANILMMSPLPAMVTLALITIIIMTVIIKFVEPITEVTAVLGGSDFATF